MPPSKDLTGCSFGRLTVIEEADRTPRGVRWLCRCDCGQNIIVNGVSLSTGNTKSCGCIHRQQLSARNRVHGLARTGPYNIWKHMRQRCRNPKSVGYPYYGGRGIDICPEWDDYLMFHNWAMANGWRDGLTIERRDVNGNYEPDNCLWVENAVQAKNKRSPWNREVERSDGKRYRLVADAARDMGVSTTQISAACSGKQKTCRGFGWRYVI
jgi:hypothetical protein